MFENEHATASRIIADIEWRRTSPPDDEDPDEFEEPDDPDVEIWDNLPTTGAA
jgi:hypothetical protein